MNESFQVDNRQSVKEIRSSLWIFAAFLLINGLIMWYFNISSIVKMTAYFLVAAGVPVLFWIALTQKTLVVEMTPSGITFMEEMGRELVVRNEIRYEDIEKIVIPRQGAEIFWCRLMPKGGKGIILGNFQNKHLEMISKLTEAMPEKVQIGTVTAEEKKEKGSNDCLL